MHLSDSEINSHPLISGDQYQTCVAYYSDNDGYGDEECGMSYCFACNLQTDVFFKLKGICAELGADSATVDNNYVLEMGNPRKNMFSFRGFNGLTQFENSALE